MKLSFLENFEEKFYFKTSHFFWHFLIGLAVLALIGGLLIFLWGITPSLKPSVDKPKFPEPVKISAAEIKLQIAPPARVTPTTKTADLATTPVPVVKEPTPPASAEPQVDPTEKAYQLALDSLKVLLPPDKFAWESRGHWETDWYEKRWVVDRVGIADQLERGFRKANAGSFESKKQILDGYLSFLSPFPVDLRYMVLANLIESAEEDVPSTLSCLNLLKSSVALFSTDKIDYLRDLVNFKKKNPNDGRPFIEYANQILPKFDPATRKSILDVLTRYYYREFKELSRQQEPTNLFIELLPSFQAEEQPMALASYYDLFLSKNQAREYQINILNSEYEAELARAEQILASKKQSKSEYRNLAWKLIGGSIIFIAFIALFLVMLSIQRNVKLLRENYLKAQS